MKKHPVTHLALHHEILLDLTIAPIAASPIRTRVNSCGVCQITKPTKGRAP